ncbi:MAG TPA: EamA family transporter [Coriobacteriia bacterium]|nr:EamA family transporter [Coriobacteriia bacterium]
MSQRAKVIIAMLTLYVVWGTTYLAIKVGIDAGLPPALFAGLRLVPAALIMFGLAKLRGASLRVSWRDFRIVSIVGLLLLVGGQYGMMVAEQYVPSGIAALVVALNPLWIALAESLFPDMQRPSALGWAGLAVGFSGLGILIWPRVAGFETGAEEMLGIAIVVLGTWLWASGSIYSKRNPVAVDALVVTAYEMLAAGIATLLIGSVLGEWGNVPVTPKAVGALLYLIFFGSCIAFTAFVFALSHLPASKVLTYAYVNPVIAVFAGWAAGRAGLVPPEPVTGATLLGMVVIVAGVALTTAAPTRPPRRAPATAADSRLAAEPLVEPQPSEV